MISCLYFAGNTTWEAEPTTEQAGPTTAQAVLGQAGLEQAGLEQAGPTTGQAGPELNPVRNCMTRIQTQCFTPLATEYMGMNTEAILWKVLSTDLGEICR